MIPATYTSGLPLDEQPEEVQLYLQDLTNREVSSCQVCGRPEQETITDGLLTITLQHQYYNAPTDNASWHRANTLLIIEENGN